MARTDNRVEIDSAVFAAEIMPYAETEGWQIGSIDPGLQSPEQLQQLGEMLRGSLAKVDEDELAYSDCTDGRFRTHLDSGLTVPVRERLVGADTVIAFTMAEALGNRFYGNDKATPAERIDEVAAFLKANNIKPSTHGSCGAAGGFVAVSGNVVKFANAPNNQNFINRQRKFVPVYDAGLFGRIVQGFGARIAAAAYEGYSDALITAAAKKYGGDNAVVQLQDDGRGVHGHRELAIVRIAEKGVSIDTNKLAGMDAENPQVFVNNDSRLELLAGKFGQGRDEDYATAFMSGEAFSNAGWGTLGKNLPTIILKRAAR